MGAVRTSEPRKVTLMQNDRCFDTSHPTIYLIVILSLFIDSQTLLLLATSPPPTNTNRSGNGNLPLQPLQALLILKV